MTKQETYAIRSNRLSNFIRNNCPDSFDGYSVTDIDFVLMNYMTKDVMLLEEKCRNAEPSYNQHKILEKLNKWIKIGVLMDDEPGWKYHGLHLIQFEKEGPDDGGEIKIDHKLVTNEQLKKFLSFEFFKKD
jgi:hypothetical protein